MGTRGNIVIKDGFGHILACIYNQLDSYPTGLGQDIIKILNDGNAKIINGFGKHKTPEYFNGSGCLAAHLVCELKLLIRERQGNDIGYIYLQNIDDFAIGDQEYTYIIEPGPQLEDFRLINISVYHDQKKIFEGELSEFKNFTKDK